MNLQTLYVAICTPNDSKLSPYVYGLFHSDEYAVEHFTEHGDKDSTLRVTREQVIPRRLLKPKTVAARGENHGG